MRLPDLEHLLRGAGAKPRHETLVRRAWARGLPLDAFAHLADFPARLRNALPALEATLRGLVSVRSEHPSADGSVRLLLALRDGRAVESVLLPGDGVCVSTQVGCAVGCVFCMTGRGGLERHLGGAEIVAQVALARERRKVRRVVLMGMGEPAHNLDEVLDALDLLGGEGALDSKNLVFSTVGDRRAFERLPLQRVKPALAVSLHTTKAELRARLLPRAPRLDPAELVELADAYARATGYPIQYQWTLLDGVNDGDDEVERLAELLAGKYAVMNFIPFNALDGPAVDGPAAGTQLGRPPQARAQAIAKALYRRGVLAKLRRSAGQDVQAGCGQLRARALTV
jgi:23S rRNA (adenine2503-C2)-methyltransferase